MLVVSRGIVACRIQRCGARFQRVLAPRDVPNAKPSSCFCCKYSLVSIRLRWMETASCAYVTFITEGASKGVLPLDENMDLLVHPTYTMVKRWFRRRFGTIRKHVVAKSTPRGRETKLHESHGGSHPWLFFV